MLRALLDRVASMPPGQCEVCHAWPGGPLCEACVARFAQPRERCRHCASPVEGGSATCGRCATAAFRLDACHAAVSYAYPWSGLIGRFKFQGEPAWARAFALLMRSTPWVEPALETADVVLPMPLAPRRLAERGFNQALLLARQLAPATTRSGLLLRLRDTPSQAALDRADRHLNVEGAFAVDPLHADRVRDRHVVLVDDVMTSGASLHGAAAALRSAGARQVTALVFARTDPA